MDWEKLKNTELCEFIQEEQPESVAMILLHFSRLQMVVRRNLNDSDILIAVSFIPRVTTQLGLYRGPTFFEH